LQNDPLRGQSGYDPSRHVLEVADRRPLQFRDTLGRSSIDRVTGSEVRWGNHAD
jgi:hypothetical protein